jgi:hypothetical protein
VGFLLLTLEHVFTPVGNLRRNPLCVPFHESQYHKKALPFFPLPEQHLVVLDEEDPYDEEAEEGSYEDSLASEEGEEPTGKKPRLAR